jgi:hypothetical protein
MQACGGENPISGRGVLFLPEVSGVGYTDSIIGFNQYVIGKTHDP